MAKFSRFDPRNKKRGLKKSRTSSGTSFKKIKMVLSKTYKKVFADAN